MSSAQSETSNITLFLAGDVMTGRGIDQILTHPSDPALHEPHAASALDYVKLAERANGPIPWPVDYEYVWGESLGELDRTAPDLRLINLETAVATNEQWEPKGINYRMNPSNVGVLTAAGIDGCVLANNHTMDWGADGLAETLSALRQTGITTIGAGLTSREARRPAVFTVPGGRVVLFAFASPTSGVPPAWSAREHRPGINVLTDLMCESVDDIARQVAALKQAGDIVVVSLHWGSNWGYDVPSEQTAFAHELIDRAGVDLVWGHSSHHPKAVEVYRGKLILYGCGDFINDYEGIRGNEAYRGDLVLMYLPAIARKDGKLLWLDMVPLQIRNFKLNRPGSDESVWLRDLFTREGRRFGTGATLGAEGRLSLHWH